MKIEVIVKPNANKVGIEMLGPRSYRVAVQAPPADGRANEAVIALLAKHFGRAKSCIKIVAGQTGRKKLVEIPVAR